MGWQINGNVFHMTPSQILSLPLPLIGVAYVCLHVLLDWASFVHPFGTFGFTPWNPSTGLIFVVVLLFGVRALWFVFLALLLANQIVRGAPVPAWLGPLEAVIVGAGYAVTLLGLLHPRLRFKASLLSTRDLMLLLAAGTIGSAIVSSVYLGMLFEAGLLQRQEIISAGFRYWVGDLIGIAVAAPFGLLALTRDRLLVPGWEALLQVCAITTVLWIVVTFAEHNQLHFLYLLFLPVTWIAVRSGLEGVSTSLVLIQVGLSVAVQLRAPTVDITDFQFRMLVLAVTGLFAGALVTERRRAEARLRANQEALANVSRLGSMGELGAAIAHEINQPLSAAGTFTGLVVESLQTGSGSIPEIVTLSRKAAAQIDRAAEVVKRLRTLVRLGRSDVLATAIAPLVYETLDMIDPDVRSKHIAVKVDIPADLPNVIADKLQIQQVLLNLIRNSMEAMQRVEDGPGQILVRARGGKTGFVELSVRDTGPGFKPGFDADDLMALTSTKPEGLGVGLPLCRTIARAHGGALRIDSDPSGARVAITLPIAERS
jgi:two-component system, LuxR family, sensor kinase FixL